MKTIKQLVSDFYAATSQHNKLNSELLRIAGLTAVKFMRKNFDQQGFDSPNSWEKRKKATNNSYSKRGKNYKGSVFNAKSPILVQTGNLRSGIKYTINGAKSVFIGVNLKQLPYAKIHNEGLDGLAFGKFPFKMPKRKFLGVSDKLKKEIFNIYKIRQNEIFKKFK